jgi:hypothetical protein
VKAKQVQLLVLFCALIVVTVLVLPCPALAGWSVQILTDNVYEDRGSQTNAGRVVWAGYHGQLIDELSGT